MNSEKAGCGSSYPGGGLKGISVRALRWPRRFRDFLPMVVGGGEGKSDGDGDKKCA